MPRIVSLIPSATEIVCALGFEHHLVGRSHECDFPASVKQLPVCTAPAFMPEGSSAEIDRRVKERLQNALSVYEVHTDLLEQLQPDIIITQAQCEVCAVSLQDVERAVCQLVASQPRIVSLEPNRLADVWADIGRVAEALDANQHGAEVVAQLQRRVHTIAERASPLLRPTVACIEWLDPPMAAGNWVPELVELAGGANLFGQAGEHSPWLQWQQVVDADPDVLVLMPCGFYIERTLSEIHVMAERPGWQALKAVQNGRVYITDGNQYFNRSGPRLVESLEILAEVSHPAVFNFGHEGSGWERMKEEL
jgi:iron complex transport system substrate-binding protein